MLGRAHTRKNRIDSILPRAATSQILECRIIHRVLALVALTASACAVVKPVAVHCSQPSTLFSISLMSAAGASLPACCSSS
jgi:hypothetical protein